jgi:peptide deformylase
MVETMHAEPGVGLAANQVADPRRVLVVDLTAGERPGQVKVFVNPRILEVSGKQDGDEGCLSFPGIYESITRPKRVRFAALDLDGRPVEETVEDFYARAVCHEVDHLDGVTFLQRMSPLKRRLVLRKIERLKRDGEWPEFAEAAGP